MDPGTSGTVLTSGMCTWHCTNTLGYWAEPLCVGREEVAASILLPALSPLWPQFSCSDFFLGDWSASPHPPAPFAPFSAVKSPGKDLLLMVSKYFRNRSQVCCIPSRWPLSVEDPGMSCQGICFARVIQFLCKLLFCWDVLQVRSSVQGLGPPSLGAAQPGCMGHACVCGLCLLSSQAISQGERFAGALPVRPHPSLGSAWAEGQDGACNSCCLSAGLSTGHSSPRDKQHRAGVQGS